MFINSNKKGFDKHAILPRLSETLKTRASNVQVVLETRGKF